MSTSDKHPYKRLPFDFRGQRMYCMRRSCESPSLAIARSLRRRLHVDSINVWLHTDRSMTGGDVYRVQWYDPRTEIFHEERVEWIGDR